MLLLDFNDLVYSRMEKYFWNSVLAYLDIEPYISTALGKGWKYIIVFVIYLKRAFMDGKIIMDVSILEAVTDKTDMTIFTSLLNISMSHCKLF